MGVAASKLAALIQGATEVFFAGMAEEGGTRRSAILLDAVDPESGGFCKIQVSYDRMNTVARRSMGQAKECAYILPAILQRPTAIFQGLKSEGDEDRRGVGWRCYCGIPQVAYRTDGSERSVWPDQVFLVFVNEENIAYNWRWERADQDDPRLPVDYLERFKQRLI